MFYHKILFKVLISSLVILALLVAALLLIFHQFLPLVPITPRLLGMDGKKTYLILLQNNAELRPGGGFIGSYGLVTLDHGKPGDLTVHNTYDADGQLKNHIEPYYISRRYLQVHLYMRDSNFDVDFVKDAQKAAFMLQQETGQQVDGVIGIDLTFVKNLVAVVAPIDIWQYNQTVNAQNFFLLTETHSDKHSFFGSTQKQDFLHSLFINMQVKIQTNKYFYAFKFIPIILDAVQQKHLLFAFLNSDIQQVLSKNRFSSALYDPRENRNGVINDFIGINEANIGVNKANFFLDRSISQRATITSSGNIVENINITYINHTKPNQWPSGGYKNYIRFILPLHTKLIGISIDNIAQHIVPAVTDFRVYEAKDFRPPVGLEVDSSNEAGKTLYGFVINVPTLAIRHLSVTYQLPTTLNPSSASTKYNLYVFKQPGTNNDPFSFTLVPQTNYTFSKKSFSTQLSTDLSFEANLIKHKE